MAHDMAPELSDEVPPPEYCADAEEEHERDGQAQEPAPVSAPAARVRVDAEEWRKQLVTRLVGPKNDKREVVLAIAANVVTFFRFDSRWKGVLAYDEFAECVVTLREAPWHAIDKPKKVLAGALTDTDIARIVVWFSRVEGLHVTDRIIEQAVHIAADANRVHPVCEYLACLVWDGVPRLDEAATKYFGAKSSAYSRLIVPRWFISTVARVRRPGCQADCVLILEGAQGWGKTSAFRALVPVDGWYADSGIVIGSKDSYQNLHGVWIYGFDELDSLSKSELTATKNFITATYDRYRPPYGRHPQNFTRQNTFVGSTNREDYLDDPTGNRRYWPLDVVRPLDVEAIRRDRDQLWAEAVHRYAAGENWYADTPELRKLCEDEQRDRVPVDAWAPIVADWLINPTVPDLEHAGERRRLTDEDGVTTTEGLIGALNMRPADITPANATRMGFVLRALGLTHVKRSSTGDRARRYREPSSTEATVDGERWTDATPRNDTVNPPSVQPTQRDRVGTQEEE